MARLQPVGPAGRGRLMGMAWGRLVRCVEVVALKGNTVHEAIVALPARDAPGAASPQAPSRPGAAAPVSQLKTLDRPGGRQSHQPGEPTGHKPEPAPLSAERDGLGATARPCRAASPPRRLVLAPAS